MLTISDDESIKNEIGSMQVDHNISPAMIIDCSILSINNISVDDVTENILESSDCLTKQPLLAALTNGDAETMRVRFHSVNIREYGMILGDNPSSRSGPPVTLDWDYNEVLPISLDQYEEHRAPRRTYQQMFMNGAYRAQMLISTAGHTEDEILKIKFDCKTIRKQRDRTRLMLPFSKMEEVAQSTSRKLRRIKSNK